MRMVRVRKGDILSVEKGIIVHGCNARGVMGSGLAKQVKEKWPECFEVYKNHLLFEAHAGHSCLGQVVPKMINENLIIANAITQEDYGREPGKVYVNYAAVGRCFTNIARVANDLQLPVHYPMIGAGLAGGSWELIEQQIDRAFEPYPEVDRFLWIYDR
jgi:O-acetyl-ADP-ribose deacetylase (regulator of RNase III)